MGSHGKKKSEPANNKTFNESSDMGYKPNCDISTQNETTNTSRKTYGRRKKKSATPLIRVLLPTLAVLANLCPRANANSITRSGNGNNEIKDIATNPRDTYISSQHTANILDKASEKLTASENISFKLDSKTNAPSIIRKKRAASPKPPINISIRNENKATCIDFVKLIQKNHDTQLTKCENKQEKCENKLNAISRQVGRYEGSKDTNFANLSNESKNNLCNSHTNKTNYITDTCQATLNDHKKTCENTNKHTSTKLNTCENTNKDTSTKLNTCENTNKKISTQLTTCMNNITSQQSVIDECKQQQEQEQEQKQKQKQGPNWGLAALILVGACAICGAAVCCCKKFCPPSNCSTKKHEGKYRQQETHRLMDITNNCSNCSNCGHPLQRGRRWSR